MGPRSGTLSTMGPRPRRPGSGEAAGLGVGVAELEGVAEALLEDRWPSWMPMECTGRWVGLGEAMETKLDIMTGVGVGLMRGRLELGPAMGVGGAAWIGVIVTGALVASGSSSATLGA